MICSLDIDKNLKNNFEPGRCFLLDLRCVALLYILFFTRQVQMYHKVHEERNTKYTKINFVFFVQTFVNFVVKIIQERLSVQECNATNRL